MHIRRCLLATAAAVLPLASLAAQERPVFVALSGGVSLPQGTFGDASDMGWHAQATLGVSTFMQPIGLRLDVAYNQFAFKDATVALLGSGNNSVASGTLNATYRLPMTNSALSPYLITGLGAYRTDCSLASCEAATHFGWNAGLGARLNVLGLVTFLEARYHRTKLNGDALAYFPITLGLTF